jgi:hypothetical protein
MDNRSIGVFVMIAGGAAVLLGAVIWTGALSWFGRLPGDIRIEKPGMRVYAPLASMLLLSLVFSLVMYLVRKLGSKD